MGKKTKRKHEILEARKPNFPVILEKSKKNEIQKENALLLFNPLSVITGYEEYAIRPLDKFVARTRSLNRETRAREMIRYAFNKYKPPEFIYSVWEKGPISCSRAGAKSLLGVEEDFKLWYLALAQGKSLYKECTMGILTKRETFYFSTCQYQLIIPQAIWYSVIRCMDEEKPMSLAHKIAITKISACKIDEFWKGVARWFISNETTVHQMNDLLDYISARHRENAEWYVKDQSLTGMLKAMRAWHQELCRSSRMSIQYKEWQGIPAPNWSIERGTKDKKVTWKFHQIKTGKELAEEGNKMHHCVSSYGHKCHSGDCSIWSLTQTTLGFTTRALTIEIDRHGRIIQARGYANRSPKNVETDVMREWAMKNGFKT